MELNIPYIVLKGSDDCAFQKGDKISLAQGSKDVLNKTVGGWMTEDDLENGEYLDSVEVEADIKHLKRRIEEKKEQLQKEIELLDYMLGENQNG